MNSVLSKLGISEFNFGACSGKDQWSKTKDDGLIESINPSNNELIASVYQSTENDYNNVRFFADNAWVFELHPVISLHVTDATVSRLHRSDEFASLLVSSSASLLVGYTDPIW